MSGGDRRIVTLLTDFGWSDPFVGIMKGVILGINPDAVLVDLCHGVAPYELAEAAFLLVTSYRYFPKGTIHVAVVDPGVGGPRRPILATYEGYHFVGPDNGLFAPLAEKGGALRVRAITAEQYFLQPVSATFHGRDVFAPVAGHLSLGVEPAAFGELTEAYVRLSLPRPSPCGRSSMRGQVLRVERYGNLVTNLERNDLDALVGEEPATRLVVDAGGRELRLVTYYAQVPAGSPGATIGSAGFLEIFVNQGNASQLLGLDRGSEVVVRRHEGG